MLSFVRLQDSRKQARTRKTGDAKTMTSPARDPINGSPVDLRNPRGPLCFSREVRAKIAALLGDTSRLGSITTRS
jgi:hypothetical protein